MAAQRDFQTTAKRSAMNCGNNRLGAGLDRVHKFWKPLFRLQFAELLDIGTTREQFARPPQNNRLHIGVGLRSCDYAKQCAPKV